jgi:hypothetical protein
MNSMRWMFLSATLILTVPACMKESHATDNRAPATDPAAAKSAEPAAPDTAAPAGSETGAGDPGATADPAAADVPTTAGQEGGKDMVAVGSSGKAKVIATGTKTVADTEAYTLKLATPAKVATGAKGSATLEIVPKKGWHLNDEFPYKLTVTPPAGTKVAKPEQGKKDTVAFSRESMKWAIDFEASSAGDKAFTGKVKFAVCTETSCDPKKEELAFNVKVE